MANIIPPPPQAIQLLPVGIYGISYDILLHATEDDLPAGWNSPRGRELHSSLSRLSIEQFHQ
jgi:hypothetical protein